MIQSREWGQCDTFHVEHPGPSSLTVSHSPTLYKTSNSSADLQESETDDAKQGPGQGPGPL